MADAGGGDFDPLAMLARADEARQRGDVAAAFRLLNDGLFEAEAAGDAGAPLVPRFQLELGRAAAAFGDLVEARSWFERAAVTEAPDLRGAVELDLGRLDARAGFAASARSHLRRAAERFGEAGDARGAARAHLELADLYVDSGDGAIARLELAAAGVLATSDDPVDRVERLVVAARVRAATGDRDGVADDLQAAIDVPANDDEAVRREELQAILEHWRAEAPALPPRRRIVASSGDGFGFSFPSIVVGRDGMIGEAAIIDAATLDPEARSGAARFISGAIRRTSGHPIGAEPRIEIVFTPDSEVFGIAYAMYLVPGGQVAASIMATGIDPRDGEVIARNDNLVSYIAGRHATDTYVGFSRYAALRPGALAAVKERPVAFFVPMPGAPEGLLRASHDRHLAVAAAFIAMIQEDGDAARRLRSVTRPPPG